ncbi:MAG: chemotaxis protein CheW [Nitrospinota bacterium]
MVTSGLSEPGQFLTFELEKEVFCIDILKIREVLDYTDVTKVPRTPDFMCGVINLRGNVVPVVDLRVKFGLGKTEKTISTCIVIVEIMLEDEPAVLGAMADSVQEVIELGPENIEAAPQIGMKLNAEFISGMGRKDEKFIIILNIDRVFSLNELSCVQKSADEQSVVNV